MRINTNISAMNAHRQLSIASTRGASSMERLSSGLRINRAGDDAAGLSISEKMRAQVRGLNQGARNAQDGISLIQTAESALNESHDILQRIRELAAQAASGTNTAEDRAAMQGEAAQLKSEIDRIGNTTEFNTKTLLNGSLEAAGAAMGQETTTGATVGRQTPAVLIGTSAMGTAAVADNPITPEDETVLANSVLSTDFTAEALTVDGVSITVNWQNLSTAERDTIMAGTVTSALPAQMDAAKDLIVDTINQAISDSGHNVAPIAGHVDTSSHLVLTSGSAGVNSGITTTAGQVLGKVMGVGTATGTSIYNGTTVASGAEFFANIGDVQFNVTTSALIDGGATAMSDAATTLQTDINTAIDVYNRSAGASAADPGFIEAVTVNALEDGRFEVVSGSGPISFSDRPGGSAVRDLGLTQAQTTETAGSGGMTLQIGANMGQTMTFGIKDMRTAALGIANVDVSTQAGASNSISSLDGAIRSVSEQRSSLGAAQNRLEHTIRNLDISKENLQASEARIRDVDMASEMMEFTKNNILQQAATAMLAQANMAPQAVLQLLG